MKTAYVGLGSNLGESENILTLALQYLSDHCSVQVRQCSSLYRSKPLIHPSSNNKSQPDYINSVAEFAVNSTALELLDKLQAAESYFGRIRTNERWASRTLDLDILLFNSEQINNERLTIPHEGLLLRDFVLFPLFEIAPHIEIPGFGAISNAIEHCENRGLVKINEYNC